MSHGRLSRGSRPTLQQTLQRLGVFRLAIAVALLLPAVAKADADGLINKQLAFRDTILGQPAPRALRGLIKEGDVTVTFVTDLRASEGKTHYFFDVDFSLPSSPAEDAAFERALESAGGLVTLPVFRQAFMPSTALSTSAIVL